MDADRARFIFQVCISAIVLVAGFGVLLFEAGDRSDATLAAGGLGVVLGHWLRKT
jgi:hypothetical protein